jgi:hypothetical protein
MGDQGAHHIANALAQNKVSPYSQSLFLVLLLTSFSLQTLITLDLGGNEISPPAVQQLANALLQNKVT